LAEKEKWALIAKAPRKIQPVDSWSRALYDCTEFMEKPFGPGGMLMNLQKLHLKLDLSQVMFSVYMHKPNKLRRDVEENLAPLGALRGLLEVAFEHSEAAKTTELCRRGRTSLAESLDEMLLVIHVHLEPLVVDMTSPDLDTVEYQKLCSPYAILTGSIFSDNHLSRTLDRNSRRLWY
jgi:hypothetical protein